MDPALRQVLSTQPAHAAVPVLARLRERGRAPAQLEVVSRFGNIVSGRVAAGEIRSTHAADEIVSLKATRPIESTNASATPVPEPNRPEGWRPTSLGASAGSGSLFAVLDFDCHFAHPAFRDEDGRTRLIAIWDQRADHDGSARHGYGAVHRRADIDRALTQPNPYEALGYAPGPTFHGSSVLDIGAGRGHDDLPPGIAPGAELAFVHLSASDTHGPATLGDSVRVAEALDFVRELANGRPWVANLSIGSNGGPRDGTTLLERAIDALHLEDPHACIVCSGGNYGEAGLHTFGVVSPGSDELLELEVDRPAPGSEIEVWYGGDDHFVAELAHPATGIHTRVELGEHATIEHDGEEVGRIYHRRSDPNNGDHHVDAFLGANAPPGGWTLRLRDVESTDGRFHASIERCGHQCARFIGAATPETATLGTIAASRSAVTVGAIDGIELHAKRSSWASTGPSRDGRAKPEFAARANGVLTVATDTPVVDGASFATPQVSGAIAALMSIGLDREEAQRALRRTGLPIEGSTAVRIRPEVAMRAAARPESNRMESHEAPEPARLWAELSRRDRFDNLEVAARAGTRPPELGAASTWIVERGPGPSNLASCYRATELSGRTATAELTDGEHRSVALLDGEGRVLPGRMLVREVESEVDCEVEALDEQPEALGTIRADSIRYLAFEGGGGKGLIYEGALRGLEARGVLRYDRNGGFHRDSELKGVAGASAGAITAMLVALGMTPAAIKHEMDRVDFGSFYDGPNPEHWIRCKRGPGPIDGTLLKLFAKTSGLAKVFDPMSGLGDSLGTLFKTLLGSAGQPLRTLALEPTDSIRCLLTTYGLFDGWEARKVFARILGENLSRIGGGAAEQYHDVNFTKFEELTGVALAMSGSNLSTGRSEIFSAKTTPAFPVADAVRISMGFPIAFKPVVISDARREGLTDPSKGLQSRDLNGFWIDGGMFDNIPAAAFGADANSMFGLRLARSERKEIDHAFDYVFALVEALLNAGEARVSPSRPHFERYLTLDTGDLSTLDFTPPKADLERFAEKARSDVLSKVV